MVRGAHRSARSLAFATIACLPLIACVEPGPGVARSAPSATTMAGQRAEERFVQVVAHRACSSHAPENSISAITACRTAGVDVIEIDVRQSADGELVLMHDDTVNRMTDGIGRVEDLTWSELSRLNLREAHGGNDTPLTDLTVPRLGEALDAAGETMLVNLDVKDTQVFRSVLALLRKRGGGANIIVKSALPPSSAQFTQFDGITPVRFMPVVRQCNEEIRSDPELFCVERGREVARAYDGHPVYGYELIFTDDRFLADFAKSQRDTPQGAGRRIWVNALLPQHAAGHTDALALTDPDAHWGRLVDLGATIIQTDYPARLKAYLAGRGQHQP